MSEPSRLWKIVEEWLDMVPFPPNQSKIADHLGVARSAVSDWKAGKSRPSPEHSRALADMMRPQLGPDVDMRISLAIMRDLGYVVAERSEEAIRLIRDDITPDQAKRIGEVIEMERRGRLVSDVVDTNDEPKAAHDEERSIEAEQGMHNDT